MKKTIHHAFARRIRDRAFALLVAAIALVPAGMPRDLADWFAAHLPMVPSWTHWALALGIAAWRVYVSSRAVKRGVE